MADTPILNQVQVNGTTYDLRDANAQSRISTLETTAHSHSNKAILDATTASYLEAEKTKLSNIDEGAQINVQSDWATTTTEDDSFIKNKPTTIEGYGITNAYIKTEVDTLLSAKADASSVYTKTESDGRFINVDKMGAASGVATLDATGKIPSTELPSYVDDIVEGYYYNNSFYEDESHTKLITPETGKIYIDLTNGNNTTWRYSGSAYVQIKGDLTLGTSHSTAFYGDYGQTAYAHSLIADGSNPHGTTFANIQSRPTDLAGYGITNAYTKTEIDTELGKKVDKVDGKGLSTNDYTTAEKNKLAGIAAGAEVNVQSNWNESSTSSDAYIKNKPTLTVEGTKLIWTLPNNE